MCSPRQVAAPRASTPLPPPAGATPHACLAPLPRLPAQGVLAPDDARRAVELGVDGIVLSNHGGRQLNYAPAAVDVLPAVAAAVQGRVPLLVDGGITRGTGAAGVWGCVEGGWGFGGSCCAALVFVRVLCQGSLEMSRRALLANLSSLAVCAEHLLVQPPPPPPRARVQM
jgi:hypothetical protein